MQMSQRAKEEEVVGEDARRTQSEGGPGQASVLCKLGQDDREGLPRGSPPLPPLCQAMSILAFVSDQHSISRILEHLGLRSPELDRPPPPREILRVAELGEGWGVPASWD